MSIATESLHPHHVVGRPAHQLVELLHLPVVVLRQLSLQLGGGKLFLQLGHRVRLLAEVHLVGDRLDQRVDRRLPRPSDAGDQLLQRVQRRAGAIGVVVDGQQRERRHQEQDEVGPLTARLAVHEGNMANPAGRPPGPVISAGARR
jgi:hypothetical protein